MINVSAGVFRTEPARLARMLDARWDEFCNWSDHDLTAILQHQLDAPLRSEWISHRVSGNIAGQRPPASVTFGDLLSDDEPGLAWLYGVKEIAKSHLRRREGRLPPGIAKVLYYASVLVARVRWNEQISQLPDEKLLSGVNWALDQPWLTPSIRRLLVSGKRVLTSQN